MQAAFHTLALQFSLCLCLSLLFQVLLPFLFFFLLSMIQPNMSNQLWGNPHFMRACHAHRDLICPVSPCFAKIPHMLLENPNKNSKSLLESKRFYSAALPSFIYPTLLPHSYQYTPRKNQHLIIHQSIIENPDTLTPLNPFPHIIPRHFSLPTLWSRGKAFPSSFGIAPACRERVRRTAIPHTNPDAQLYSFKSS